MSQNGRDSVEAMFRDTLELERKRKAGDRALLQQTQREGMEQDRVEPVPPRGVHYTQLPEAQPGEPLAEEWNTYRREIGRWLAEGLGGRHVLIKGEEIIGIYESSETAMATGLNRYLLQPFFVHPIRAEEPYLRIRGINHPWPGSRLQ